MDLKSLKRAREEVRLERESILRGLPSMRAIVEQVAEEAGISLALIMGDRRHGNIVQARHLAMYRASEAGFTLGMIGLFFNRDHTSISYAVRKIAASSPQSTRIISTRPRFGVELSESSETIGS